MRETKNRRDIGSHFVFEKVRATIIHIVVGPITYLMGVPNITSIFTKFTILFSLSHHRDHTSCFLIPKNLISKLKLILKNNGQQFLIILLWDLRLQARGLLVHILCLLKYSWWKSLSNRLGPFKLTTMTASNLTESIDSDRVDNTCSFILSITSPFLHHSEPNNIWAKFF